MNSFREKIRSSPVYARVAPFFVFLIITTAGGLMGGDWKFWLYAAKVFVGAWLIWEMRPFVKEMRWAFSWEAVVVGILIFVIWVGLDPYYPKNHLFWEDTAESVWDPFARFGEGSSTAWALVCIRIAGMTLVVPPLEEVFYRSFLYRYGVQTNFTEMPFNRFHPTAFIVVSIVFGLVHFQWLPGILCGMAYQGLVLRKNRLGDAITAHAITNFLLGVYVVWKQGDAWKFF
ncbi:MAG TPA: CAAX prenyl protease-related protein [Verrucomicrobia bacterium]|nr:CAAX prenyl protease-related protein [Verrucomicrobiota bacterium]HOB31443.1 CAAX prenyl protease-related protein [Verrucomicrobiota bacterium]HOP96761.1 CAAX prenyl protease-related protein [Verrucomicrobiota bacterium]HPU56802.1 CAAX prenyl protease-related protein [Verrucomicrobiota bacterium]